MSPKVEEQTVESMPAGYRTLLRSRPVQNQAARKDRYRESLQLTVRNRKPFFLIPPFSWFIRPSMQKRLILDPLGEKIWGLCNGERTVEQIVDLCAEEFQYTFHEARVAVSSYLQSLIQRGAIALVLPREDKVPEQ